MRISDTLLDIITALRTAIELDDTSHTTSMTRELSRLPEFEGSTATAGYHVSPEGDIKDDHWWLIMDDGSVFDADADEPTRCSKKDSRHGRYFPYTGETGIPAEVLQAADHLRASSRVAKNKSFVDMVGEASEEPGNYPPSDHSNTRISELKDELRNSSLAPHIKIFGSAATDKQYPKDLDILIDLSGMEMTDEIERELSRILELASTGYQRTMRNHGTSGSALQGRYSGLFDPFVLLPNGTLVVRSENGAQWVKAIHARAILKTAQASTIGLGEASGASAPSAAPRQAPEALPDAMTMGGQEGITIDAFDDETKPEDLQMGWQDLVGEDEGEPVKMGINVNDKAAPWTDWILNGQKTIETRNSNSLRPYIGKRVGIVRTGKGPAMLVGYVTLGEPKVYKTAEDFDADYEEHRVPTDLAGYEFSGVKYGYPVSHPERIEPRPIKSRGIVSRNIEEVDHPEYMPGGEGSDTADYDPTYDERSVNTNAGHPRP